MSPDEKKQPEYGSDLIVDCLRKYGIEYISANIGSTFRGLWDSLVNYGDDVSPKTIAVCHEEIAVAIAHGYAKASGKPMAAILHDTVGLQHATMAIYNAWCDRVPIILLGASGPMDPVKRRPWIDWIHTSMIPNDAVRDYVKWDDLALSIESFLESFARGYNLAVTGPSAPVFISLDSECLERKLDGAKSISEMPAIPSFPAPSDDSLQRIVDLLLDSNNPYIVAGTVGRNPQSVGSLVKIAETVGARVLDTLDRFNFPNTNPLDVSDKMDLAEADFILALDALKLEFSLSKINKSTRESRLITRSDVRIARVGLEDLLTKGWAADYQGLVSSELSILADTSNALPRLAELCSRAVEKAGPSMKNKILERKERARTRHRKQRDRWVEEAKRQWDDVPVSLPRLALEAWELVKGSDWVIANGSLEGWARRLWDWNVPGCFLGDSGGAGLGYGLPASIGASLALKNHRDGKKKLVIDFQADGDFLFVPSALWTAAHYQVPVLILMFNNRLYYNDAEHNKLVAEARARDSRRAYDVGGRITEPSVDFAKLAGSYGVYGRGPIEKPDEIRGAIEAALNVVEAEGKPALVDIVTKAR